MTLREESRPAEEAKQMQAEFPESGTPANPLDEEWLSLTLSQENLHVKSD